MNKIIGKIYKRLKRLFAKDADELRIRKLRNLYYNHKVNVNVNDNVNSLTPNPSPGRGENVNDNGNGNGDSAGNNASEVHSTNGNGCAGAVARGVRGLWRSITTIKEVLKEYEDTCYLR